MEPTPTGANKPNEGSPADSSMKQKLAIVALVAVILLLGVALLIVHNNAEDQKKRDAAEIIRTSNQVVQVTGQLTDQKTVNSKLESTLTQRNEQLAITSNQLIGVSSALAATNKLLSATAAELAKTKADARAAAQKAAADFASIKKQAEDDLAAAKLAAATTDKQRLDEIARRDARIAALNSNQQQLTQKMTGLESSIKNLNDLIAKTEKDLETTKGDKEFLLKELKRLQAEKAEMERQMNDLAFLREQVSKLKEELSIARRLDWIRRGIFGPDQKKGGQLLSEGWKPVPASTNGTSANVLNVELKKDGTVNIIPPPKPAPTKGTNAPAKSGSVTITPGTSESGTPAAKK